MTTDHKVDIQAQQRETLARMSRQIAEFFGVNPGAEAAALVAEHINQFWSTSMRRDLRALFSDTSSELHPLVRKAWGAINWPKG